MRNIPAAYATTGCLESKQACSSAAMTSLGGASALFGVAVKTVVKTFLTRATLASMAGVRTSCVPVLAASQLREERIRLGADAATPFFFNRVDEGNAFLDIWDQEFRHQFYGPLNV